MHQTLRNFNFFVIFFFFPNTLFSESFNLTEVADGVFVHFGVHEDSNPSNYGDISNLGFIIGKNASYALVLSILPGILSVFVIYAIARKYIAKGWAITLSAL